VKSDNDDNLLGKVFDKINIDKVLMDKSMREKIRDYCMNHYEEYVQKATQKLLQEYEAIAERKKRNHEDYIYGNRVKISLGADNSKNWYNNIDDISMLEIHNDTFDKMATVDESLIDNINSLTYLGSLAIFDISITSRLFQLLDKLRFLLKISITNSIIHDDILEYFNNFTNLETLYIYNSSLVHTVMRNLQSNTKMLLLTLENCSLTDKEFVNFPSLCSLEYLTLGRNNLTCTNFGFIKDMPNLTSINVHDNYKLKDDGVKILATSGRISIRDIWLHDCPLIDDSCMKYLLGMEKIQSISFIDTGITESGLKQLRTIKTLRHLFVPEQITVEFAKRLQEEYMPKCYFTWKDHEKDLDALEWSEDYD
jgi:hypothetical protein